MKTKAEATLTSIRTFTAVCKARKDGSTPTDVYELIQQALLVAADVGFGNSVLRITQPFNLKAAAAFEQSLEECRFTKRPEKERGRVIARALYVVIQRDGEFTFHGYANYADYVEEEDI